VDLVVNNAGVVAVGQVGELSLEDWRWTLEVNLMGVVHGCHVFVPRLRWQRHGHILNVASMAGLLCPAGAAAYNVTKAAVIALSETLAMELSGTGIGVTVLCPMFFRSRIIENGRFADSHAREAAQRRVTGGEAAEVVARAALAAVERNVLLAMPMADGHWLWRMKRVAPRLFQTAAGLAMRRSFAKHPVV
jgi:short-subunit dehydrogenase